MDHDPALAVVNARLARQEPTARQLADQSYATATVEEAELLRLRVRTTRPCRELRLAAVKARYPHFEPSYTTLYYQAGQVFEYLTGGLITYGAAKGLAGESLAEFKKRSSDYASESSGEARKTLAAQWLEALQRAHSDPPPSLEHRDMCHWREINIASE